MFVVFGIFSIFVMAGKPMRGAPLIFIPVILASASLGELAAGFYSEPMNRWLCARWGTGAKKLGSVIEPSAPIENVAV